MSSLVSPEKHKNNLKIQLNFSNKLNLTKLILINTQRALAQLQQNGKTAYPGKKKSAAGKY